MKGIQAVKVFLSSGTVNIQKPWNKMSMLCLNVYFNELSSRSDFEIVILPSLRKGEGRIDVQSGFCRDEHGRYIPGSAAALPEITLALILSTLWFSRLIRRVVSNTRYTHERDSPPPLFFLSCPARAVVIRI